jgi:hypothetical protein
MATFYYKASPENRPNERKAKADQPVKNGAGQNFADGVHEPIIVTDHSAGFGGDETSAQSYIYGKKLNVDGDVQENTDTISNTYPGADVYGDNNLTQYYRLPSRMFVYYISNE